MSEERIRKRVSYKRWDELYEFILSHGLDVFEVLREIHRVMNGMGAYHTNYNAEFSEESLELLIKDKRGVK